MIDTLIGVDPGCTGAIVVLRDGQPVRWLQMPTAVRGTKSSRVNGAALSAFLREFRGFDGFQSTHAFIEQVGAMPGQGVTSMFTFGHATGTAEGVIAGLEIPCTLIAPQTWKKRAGLSGSNKDAARTRAIQLWPWWRDLDTITKGQAFADAALIAYYGNQNETPSTPRKRPAPRRVKLRFVSVGSVPVAR